MTHTQAELFATLMRTTSDYARAVRSFMQLSEGMLLNLQIDRMDENKLHILCDENPQETLGLTLIGKGRISLRYVKHNFSHPAMPNLEIFWLEEKPFVEVEQ